MKKIIVVGAVFVDIKGYPLSGFVPTGRNAGRLEQVHGGVSRNIVEDIANVELRPTYVSLVDDTGAGDDVLRKLRNHKVNTDYVRRTKDGMGTWLAIFDNHGDVYASISKRPDLSPIAEILDEQGDEIFKDAGSVLLEIDMEKDITRRIFALAGKYNVPVFAAVSNMSIAVGRRDYLQKTDCFVCNKQEAGILFSEDFEDVAPEDMVDIISDRCRQANFRRLCVTMGGDGSVWADDTGAKGYCPANTVTVVDTTGAGDAFFSGVSIGLTYGKSMEESCRIGTRLAASVLVSDENVCPRFLPSEFGIEPEG